METLKTAIDEIPIVGPITDPMAGVYASVGLRSPLTRGIATGAAAWLLLDWLQPRFLYKADGSERPWSLMSDEPGAVLFAKPLVVLLLSIFAAGL